MTSTPPTHHLARAAELSRVADRKINDGIYEGGDTAFTQTVIALAELHVRIAAAAAALAPAASEAGHVCPYGPDVRHAPHDDCPGALMNTRCPAALPHPAHAGCVGLGA